MTEGDLAAAIEACGKAAGGLVMMERERLLELLSSQ